jgi:thioredoxin:protein disulfide reductase
MVLFENWKHRCQIRYTLIGRHGLKLQFINKYKRLFLIAWLIFFWAGTASLDRALAASPFVVSVKEGTDKGDVLINVDFKIPEGHFLYADSVRVTSGGGIEIVPVDVPAPKVKKDPATGRETGLYDRDFRAVYRTGRPAGPAMEVVVHYQGCSESMCFLPETAGFKIGLNQAGSRPSGDPENSTGSVDSAMGWKALSKGFSVRATASGYMRAGALIRFMDKGEGPTEEGEKRNLPANRNWLLTILLIIAGGLALNLTPCVLPMIPITLAVIGAGTNAGSRKRGFALGAAYGLAMAAVYGALGLVVVLTGSRFGALNASPWFNGVIAFLFVVLSLGMFGVFNIDFTRFQARAGSGAPSGRGGLLLAFSIGAVGALLAGACVAPVVISVLLLSGDLYARGVSLGLALPFLLGAAMGLPWPFAGAGLSFLPRPGKWMVWVKTGFGVIILCFAVYYGTLAYEGFAGSENPGAGVHSGDGAIHVSAKNSTKGLAAAMEKARKEGKPLFIDFWASWCKNCLAMDKTTFRDPRVRERMKEFVFVKYRAERPNESPAREVLDHFGVIGLPTYVILGIEGLKDPRIRGFKGPRGKAASR